MHRKTALLVEFVWMRSSLLTAQRVNLDADSTCEQCVSSLSGPALHQTAVWFSVGLAWSVKSLRLGMDERPSVWNFSHPIVRSWDLVIRVWSAVFD